MELQIETPLDLHLHLREGAMLQQVAPFSAAQFAAGVIMPNLVEPVDSLQRLRKYRQQVQDACGDVLFTPLMTLFFREYSREELVAAKDEIIGLKLYPAGITTQSEGGVRDFDRIGETVSLLEELDIPLLVHGESNGFVMDREQEFLPVYSWLAENFPRLRIVMEHITTAKSVELLNRYDNVAATVTLHHLLITLDDVAGGLLQPDLFCKPIAKRPEDREALCQAVFSGHPRLFFGSDSAPHPRHKKECCGCAAGVFSAPVALPMLAQLFEANNCLEKLAGFVSNHGRTFYRINPPSKSAFLERAPWQVPESHGSVTSFLSGQVLEWRMKNTEQTTSNH